ncbi:hypothetical protein AB0A71_41665 [Kitasatospora aureofaciens]|uniref:hypothetical protein n=1 Tax=Kitasatospora aureofaciens TaxID=1894 RepID=UPI003411B0F4
MSGESLVARQPDLTHAAPTKKAGEPVTAGVNDAPHDASFQPTCGSVRPDTCPSGRRRGAAYIDVPFVLTERRSELVLLAGTTAQPLYTALARAELHHLTENEDREDFNIIERAMGLEQLLKACGGNAAEVARRRGRDRSWVGNQITLLTLPSAIQDRLASGEMAERYGRRLARAYKDDRSLTTDDLLALEEKLKEEERAKRIAQRDALKMLSADNIPTAAHPLAAESPQTTVLSADNTEAAEGPAGVATSAKVAAPEREMLSADNTNPSSAPLIEQASARVPTRQAPFGSTAETPQAPLPRQTPAPDPIPSSTATQLVQALGGTARGASRYPPSRAGH